MSTSVVSPERHLRDPLLEVRLRDPQVPSNDSELHLLFAQKHLDPLHACPRHRQPRLQAPDLRPKRRGPRLEHVNALALCGDLRAARMFARVRGSYARLRRVRRSRTGDEGEADSDDQPDKSPRARQHDTNQQAVPPLGHDERTRLNYRAAVKAEAEP
jgi:hypothetical protein